MDSLYGKEKRTTFAGFSADNIKRKAPCRNEIILSLENLFVNIQNLIHFLQN
jgi:hypothetical protein